MAKEKIEQGKGDWEVLGSRSRLQFSIGWLRWVVLGKRNLTKRYERGE